VIVNNVRFVITAVKQEQYPKSDLMEVAFVGRSNLGKSTLLNYMANRKSIARISSTPGKTREINFYNIEEKLHFVDLPGYGYAKVSKEKKSTWSEVIETYLTTREQLKLLVMIIDIRHDPTNDDMLMFDWILAKGFNYVIVATKADKIKRSQINIRLNELKKDFNIEKENVLIPFSSVLKLGRDELWEIIMNQII